MPASSTSDSLVMPDHALPAGTKIDSFRITGLIGEGGFGIVYKAFDSILQREVAVKEYLPAMLAVRAERSMQVLMRSTRLRESFAGGLRGFLAEARMLARFDHPAVLKVHRYWEGNGTAYMVMPYYQGRTLRQLLDAQGGAPDEAQLRSWLDPLLDAVQALHTADCLHRDIAPDNILITATGPVLLDFGAARHLAGQLDQTRTVMLKPGYAPLEQYAESAATPQGPWTDIYAVAAVLSTAITGQVPKSAVERILDDRQPPLSRSHAGRYRPGFLHAIDAALAVRPEQRPRSMAQWRAMLDAPDAATVAAPARWAGRRHGAAVAAVAAALAGLALMAALGRFEPAAGGATQTSVDPDLASAATPAATAPADAMRDLAVVPEGAMRDLAVVPEGAMRDLAVVPEGAMRDLAVLPEGATAPRAPAARTAPAARPALLAAAPARRADPAAPRPLPERCSALLQQASLKPLSREDVEQVREQCR